MLMHIFAGHLTILAPKFDAREVWRTIERPRRAADLHDRRRDGTAADRGVRARRLPTRPRCSPSPAAPRSSAARSRSAGWRRSRTRSSPTPSAPRRPASRAPACRTTENIKGEGAMVSLGAESVVLDEDNHVLDLATNVGAVGRLARSGSVPVGYYKDPEKSARTFIEVDGVRYLGARRLRADRGRRQGDPARPRLQLRQHRRGEGLPRGGRDGAQGPPRASTTPWWSASPTRTTARPSPR